MHAGMLGTLQALWDVFPLFSNTGWGESSNLAFLEKHMGANFEPRPEPWVTNVTTDQIQSGDLLAISKIRGRWGGFETLEKWVSGAYAGHSAVALRDSEGKLWVGESGNENDKVTTTLQSAALKLSCKIFFDEVFFFLVIGRRCNSNLTMGGVVGI